MSDGAGVLDMEFLDLLWIRTSSPISIPHVHTIATTTISAIATPMTAAVLSVSRPAFLARFASPVAI